ncbi:MAG: hypothetical protein ACI8XO_001710 [Verrucomicrobiales bacterium]|jgi:hypothetical protein
MADSDNDHENDDLENLGDDADFLKDPFGTDSQLDELTFSDDALTDIATDASGSVDELLGSPIDAIDSDPLPNDLDDPAADELLPRPSDESFLTDELPDPEFDGTPIAQRPRDSAIPRIGNILDKALSGSELIPSSPKPEPEPQPEEVAGNQRLDPGQRRRRPRPRQRVTPDEDEIVFDDDEEFIAAIPDEISSEEVAAPVEETIEPEPELPDAPDAEFVATPSAVESQEPELEPEPEFIPTPVVIEPEPDLEPASLLDPEPDFAPTPAEPEPQPIADPEPVVESTLESLGDPDSELLPEEVFEPEFEPELVAVREPEFEPISPSAPASETAADLLPDEEFIPAPAAAEPGDLDRDFEDLPDVPELELPPIESPEPALAADDSIQDLEPDQSSSQTLAVGDSLDDDDVGSKVSQAAKSGSSFGGLKGFVGQLQPLEMACLTVIFISCLGGAFLFNSWSKAGIPPRQIDPKPAEHAPDSIDGAIAKIGKLEAYWRPKSETDSPKITSDFLPVLNLTLDSSSKGYLLAIFRNAEGDLVDTADQKIEGGKFVTTGKSSGTMTATSGLPNDYALATYRVENKWRWSVTLRESADQQEWTDLAVFYFPGESR